MSQSQSVNEDLESDVSGDTKMYLVHGLLKNIQEVLGEDDEMVLLNKLELEVDDYGTEFHLIPLRTLVSQAMKQIEETSPFFGAGDDN